MLLDHFMGYEFKRYKLPLITVYKHPAEYPESYVARLWDVDVAQPEFIVKDNLEEIRDAIPARFVRLEREPTDDPVIVEVWV